MATINGTTGDGYAQSEIASSWASARNHSGSVANNSNERDAFAILCFIEEGKTGNNFGIRRVFMYFDTSGISVAPSAATLKVYGHSQNSGDIIAVKHEAADPIVAAGFNDLVGASTALGNSDGSGTGTLAGVSGFTYSAEIATWSTTGYNDIALNSTALSDMASLDDFKICLMNYDSDYLDVIGAGANGLWNAEGIGYSKQPYIDYTAGTAAAADNATFFGSNF